QFFDLSLKDGALTTRLVLLQGSASFYVNPARDDYFSVTGGDFTVEANGRATFRVDNYSDGSTVEDERGPLTVLHGDQTTRLNKGQSLSMKAGDQLSVNVGRVPAADEFDQWVSGRVDNVSTATTAALQYTSSPYYTSGFADLYSYGSFFNCGGYGYGWRPFGAGFGWSPFTDGQWVSDPAFGWTWVSYQPWGWAPYHYGGWLFDSGCGGWFYSPPLYYGYYPGTIGRRPPRRVNPPRPIFHPATAVFVRNNGKLGLVPMHPLDEKGKTPLNFAHGVFSPAGSPAGSKAASDQMIAAAPGQKWETLKSAPKNAFTNSAQSTAPPVRVSRTVLEGASGTRVVSMSKDSSITYDPKEHRFVNSNSGLASSPASEKETRAERERAQAPASGSAHNTAAITAATAARNSTPPPRITTPPPAPRYSGGGTRGSSAGASSTWGGSRSSGSSGASSAGSSGHAASAPAPASHASSGGRPH
ncbi:MAG TPA: DUF6600 domain-containing protein, partial [Candidatus Acidoferrum sp.]|nr:DUF6600 domain-containing protein [Candidatus Acidoferrum sp.]